jgi:FRG domain
MTEKKIETIGRFLDEVGRHRKNWKVPEHKELWFRGESRDHQATLLRPELYRSRKSSALGGIDKLLDIELELHDEFQRSADQFRSEGLDPKYWHWDSYFLLQHHGGATRLLDWSDGALMALHFAIRDHQNEGDAFIYILQPDHLKERLKDRHAKIEARWRRYIKKKSPGGGLNEEDWEDAWLPSDEAERADFPIPHSPMVLDFPHITRRVAAQRSRFVVFGTEPDFLADEYKRKGCITRLCIDGKSRRDLRRELRDSGVTESVIYPDLDGVGREMKQLWNDRK